MTIVDLEQLPPDDRAAIQAMVEAAYRKAPALRANLNDEAPSNAAHQIVGELARPSGI